MSRYQCETQESATENEQLRELSQLLIKQKNELNFQLFHTKRNYCQLKQFQENYFDTSNGANNSKRKNMNENINSISTRSHNSTITTLNTSSNSNRNRSEGI